MAAQALDPKAHLDPISQTHSRIPRRLATTTSARLHAATPSSPFLKTCGRAFCKGGSAFSLYGASALFASADPAATMERARAQGLNTVRLVNFLHEDGNPASAPYDASSWRAVDREIAQAASAGLLVILDLSTYRNLLQRHGNPYTTDWGPFLRWVAARKNTVTNVVYRDDPTIGMIALAGEADGPNSSSGRAMNLTTQEVTRFYARSAREWKAADPNHIVSTGGFLYLDWNSGIDWRAIGGLSDIDVLAVHVYSDNDRTMTVPAVAAWARNAAKPWLVEEFGQTQSTGDSTRAAYFRSVISDMRARGTAGVAFWNLGPEVAPGSHDVNPSTPLTWRLVKELAPGH